MDNGTFKVYPASNNFALPVVDNIKQNILAGPNVTPWKGTTTQSMNRFWNHSPGSRAPMVPEEQGFPIYGNVGELVKQEAVNQFQKCSRDNPIGGSNNCTAKSAFIPDYYTPKDTCGKECVLSQPEAFGDKDFGFPEGSPKYTNIHGIHAYENIRAGSAGQGPSQNFACFEHIPSLGKGPGDTCYLQQPAPYAQVGVWSDLPEFNNIVHSSFNPNPQIPIK
jgi:hypothetical protein